MVTIAAALLLLVAWLVWGFIVAFALELWCPRYRLSNVGLWLWPFALLGAGAVALTEWLTETAAALAVKWHTVEVVVEDDAAPDTLRSRP